MLALYDMQPLDCVFVWLVIDSLMVDFAQENQVLVSIQLAIFQQSRTRSSSRSCDDMGLVTHDGRWSLAVFSTTSDALQSEHLLPDLAHRILRSRSLTVIVNAYRSLWLCIGSWLTYNQDDLPHAISEADLQPFKFVRWVIRVLRHNGRRSDFRPHFIKALR
jgi:hypothetical protein